ncbi:MAG TPA: N-acetylglucosamine-specific PTS transporter subunit IIBC [Synergistaceae bacterium]|nr:N-acetylglucosamine-specific PTS transporter subunit IIBC [Synergistaceae bacterium]HPQ36960.1 N-acetylglucosamine-specific PTS transporter subunit IIBC [Synergistaceae bacterium]
MKFFGKIQKLGKALMLPVAVLPAAALLLRLGAPDVFDIPFIMKAGGAIFDNLALIFAIGVAIGMAFDNGGAAGLAGAIGYLTLTNAVVTINDSINMGVLAGIISGLLGGAMYNKFHNVKLPDFLGFFGGKRFVPIATAGASILLALLFGYAWPPIQNAIHSAGEWIIQAGTSGAFVFGFLNRLLIPVGLHHVLNSMVWFVFGTFTDPATGQAVTGDLSRFFAGDPSAGIFMTGFYPIMMFALPAAALAMYSTARSENKKAIAGVLFSVAFTSFLTGITEPIEFAFMFLAPVLYVLHSLLTGVSLAVCHVLGIHHGFGFSAGAIDYFLNMGLATKGWLLLPLGLLFGVLYYFLFVWFIRMFKLATPGRVELETAEASIQETGLSMEGLAEGYVKALGGKENIEGLDACITRLRLTLKDTSVISDDSLKALGCTGVLRSKGGNSMQVVVGTKAEILADTMKALMK